LRVEVLCLLDMLFCPIFHGIEIVSMHLVLVMELYIDFSIDEMKKVRSYSCMDMQMLLCICIC
jgi:hypothetical protein